MPTGKGQGRKMLKEAKFKKVKERQELRAKRSDKDQLKLLDTKNLVAKKEREKIEKNIRLDFNSSKEYMEIKDNNAST